MRSHASQRERTRSAMQVFVVDDDVDTCDNLRIGLRAFGDREVIVAYDVASGVATAPAARFQAGFIDLSFLDGSGIDGLRAFVLARPGARAFLMSAYQQQESVAFCFARIVVRYHTPGMPVDHLDNPVPAATFTYPGDLIAVADPSQGNGFALGAATLNLPTATAPPSCLR